VDVRPLRWGIRPKIAGNSYQFTLTQPCKLSLELNGEFSRRSLFLFADAPEVKPPREGDPRVRYFPAGQHEAGAIEMSSDETVYLAAGAIVRGWIHAQDARNVRVCGPGIVLGTGTTNMPGRRRSRFVHFQNCTNVAVEGVTLVDSPTWQVVPMGCENVSIRNVKIVSDNGGDDGIDVVSSRNVSIADCFIRTKDDCIAVKSFAGPTNEVGTCDLDVSHSVFWNAAWGNGLEIGFELRATEVRDISFRDCDVIHVEDGAVFSIHNGDLATVRNIRFENIRVEDARQKLFDLAIFLTQYSLDRPTDPEERRRRYLNGAWDGVLSVSPAQHAAHAPHRGQVQDVVFKDIAVVDGQLPFSVISGFDAEHPIQNVAFDNLTVHGQRIRDAEQGKFFLEHARNIKFK
jgi:polygalacturonase